MNLQRLKTQRDAQRDTIEKHLQRLDVAKTKTNNNMVQFNTIFKSLENKVNLLTSINEEMLSEVDVADVHEEIVTTDEYSLDLELQMGDLRDFREGNAQRPIPPSTDFLILRATHSSIAEVPSIPLTTNTSSSVSSELRKLELPQHTSICRNTPPTQQTNYKTVVKSQTQPEAVVLQSSSHHQQSTVLLKTATSTVSCGNFSADPNNLPDSSDITCNKYIEHYQKKSIENGHYVANLPWKIQHPDLPTNYDVTLRRTQHTIQQLSKDSDIFKQYREIIAEQERHGFIEKVSDTDDMPTRIPHHPVKKESFTTPIRISGKQKYLAALSEDHCVIGNNSQIIAVGDVVQVHDDGPRSQWRLAVIQELIKCLMFAIKFR